MAHLVILPAAQADLSEIGDFIALDNPGRAATFVDEIEARLLQIASRPSSFPARDDLYEGLRSARHGRYLIFFIGSTEKIEVIRILHAARNLQRIFG